jgi:hypothetical protein
MLNWEPNDNEATHLFLFEIEQIFNNLPDRKLTSFEAWYRSLQAMWSVTWLVGTAGWDQAFSAGKGLFNLQDSPRVVGSTIPRKLISPNQRRNEAELANLNDKIDARNRHTI